jgi:hypothetical protein
LYKEGVFYNKKSLSGIKLGAISKEYKVVDIKLVTKQLGVTVNDIFNSLISVSLGKY